MITTPVAALVLLSALMHAGWNYLVKSSPDRLLDTVGLTLAASLIAAVLLPFVPLPAVASWPWLAATLAIHVVYFVALVQAYRHADLSVAYPLMRGSAPVLVALFMPLIGEAVPTGLVLGIACIAFGITLPVWFGIRRGLVGKPGLIYAFANAGIIAAYTVFDGIGVRLSGNPAAYTLWLFFLNAWGILALARWRRGNTILAHLRLRWRPAIAGAVLTMGSYGIVLWAMTVAPIPAVAALRETSVIFAALLGSLLLKERMGPLRTGGAIFVMLGAVLIRWA